MSKNSGTNIPDVLSCLLTRDAATDRWIGHCLDFDLVTSGKNPDAAWEHLCGVIKVHVEHCFTHHREGLRFKAKGEDWALFTALKGKQNLFRQEKITLRLTQPEQKQIPPFWVKAFEADLGGACATASSANALQAVH